MNNQHVVMAQNLLALAKKVSKLNGLRRSLPTPLGGHENMRRHNWYYDGVAPAAVELDLKASRALDKWNAVWRKLRKSYIYPYMESPYGATCSVEYTERLLSVVKYLNMKK